MALIEDINHAFSKSVMTTQDIAKEKIMSSGNQRIKNSKRSI
jgi:hypothetical protein